MAIRDLVTEGFGNGTFNGTITLVTTHGYAIGAALITTQIVTYRIDFSYTHTDEIDFERTRTDELDFGYTKTDRIDFPGG